MDRGMVKRAIAVGTAFVMAVGGSVVGVSAKPFTDTESHWASALISKWSDYDLLVGDGDGSFAPNRSMTVGEVAQVVSALFGYQEKAPNRFSDVPSGKWYEPAILKLAAAGLMPKAGAVTPEKPITRGEAFVLFAKAFEVPTVGGKTRFVDDADIPTSQKPYIKGLQNAGMLAGVPVGDGFAAHADKTITRAELMAAFDQMAGDLLDKSGAYADSYPKNVVVNTGGVTLSQAKVGQDLFIAPGVGEGEVWLKGVSVTGTIYVRGGGAHSVHLDDVTAKHIVVEKPGVRLGTTGKTHTSRITVRCSVTIENENDADAPSADIVEVEQAAAESRMTVNLKGAFETLSNKSPGVEFGGEANIKNYEGVDYGKKNAAVVIGNKTIGSTPALDAANKATAATPAPSATAAPSVGTLYPGYGGGSGYGTGSGSNNQNNGSNSQPQADMSIRSNAVNKGVLDANYGFYTEPRNIDFSNGYVTTLSPDITVSNPPAGTKGYAVRMTDLSTLPSYEFLHWSAVGFTSPAIPADASRNNAAIVQGANWFGTVGYGGPWPDGTHTYRITVYALDVAGGLGLKSGYDDEAEFFSATNGHILGKASLTATYTVQAGDERLIFRKNGALTENLNLLAGRTINEGDAEWLSIGVDDVMPTNAFDGAWYELVNGVPVQVGPTFNNSGFLLDLSDARVFFEGRHDVFAKMTVGAKTFTTNTAVITVEASAAAAITAWSVALSPAGFEAGVTGGTVTVGVQTRSIANAANAAVKIYTDAAGTTALGASIPGLSVTSQGTVADGAGTTVITVNADTVAAGQYTLYVGVDGVSGTKPIAFVVSGSKRD